MRIPVDISGYFCSFFLLKVCRFLVHLLCWRHFHSSSSPQRSFSTRGCRMCLCSAPEGSSAGTESPPCWRPTSSAASPCSTGPSPTARRRSWSSAAGSWRSCSAACRTAGRRWSSEAPSETSLFQQTSTQTCFHAHFSDICLLYIQSF